MQTQTPNPAPSETLTVALVTDLFFDDPSGECLRSRLNEARRAGAALAVLPELPLNPWSPAGKAPREEDAEAPGGPRHRLQGEAARTAGLALLGGAIVRDPKTGRRHNTALVFDAAGEVVLSYRKLHLPEEEGFWETSHYEPGDEPPQVTDRLGIPLGVQICSDANRPEGTHVLGALGAEAVLVPRATPPETYARWRLVLAANAVTSAAYVISVNRPAGEPGAAPGGPSVAVAPDGEVLLETTEPLAVVTLERRAVAEARREYPGYLPVRSRLYADAWRRVAGATSTPTSRT